MSVWYNCNLSYCFKIEYGLKNIDSYWEVWKIWSTEEVWGFLVGVKFEPRFTAVFCNLCLFTVSCADRSLQCASQKYVTYQNAATFITNYKILEIGWEIPTFLKSVALKLLVFQQFSPQNAVPYYNDLTCHKLHGKVH